MSYPFIFLRYGADAIGVALLLSYALHKSASKISAKQMGEQFQLGEFFVGSVFEYGSSDDARLYCVLFMEYEQTFLRV